MATVQLKNVKKIYPFISGEGKKKKKKDDAGEDKKVNLQITDQGVVAVQEFNLDIADKEFIVLVGPSGCGKSTTLRMVAGLEEITEGELYIDGKLMNDVAPKDRDIAMVFQNYALYPHMTVYENMAFSLKLRKEKKDVIDKKVREAAEILDITQYLDRKPKALSGGQRQRVAIGRAIVRDPAVFLMDEPLSNLDAKLRVEMQVEIKRIQKELGITTIIVTHDHEEAVSLADRVIVMNAGHILQIGKPQEVFDRPASPFIADFMGFSTFIHGVAAGTEGEMRLIRCGSKTLQVPAEYSRTLAEGDPCVLAIRSENIRIAEQEGPNTVRGTVRSATYKGHTTRLEVSGCFDEMVYPAIYEYADVQEGSEVLLHFPAQHFCIYQADAE